MASTGWKTTEFWLTLTVVGGSVLTELSHVNILPPKYAGLAAAVAAGLYAVGRGIKKAGAGGGA
jgi:hypothetical protein